MTHSIGSPVDAAHAIAGNEPLLYSETPTDERGNFAYTGDLFRAREDLASLCARIDVHLRCQFPALGFSLVRTRFAGGRKIKLEIADTPMDLRDPLLRDALLAAVRDQIERFGFMRSNIYQDYMSVSFFSEVAIGKDYWMRLAARTELQNPVEPRLSLAQFKRTIKPGDILRLIHAPWDGRNLGIERRVDAVRSGDIIIAGSYLTLPRAAGFACDGRQIRIAMGDATDPDAHLLYEWTRCSD
ncbi:hypothetical protein SAMN05518849_10713 [Sphingobium sp. AP50]|uniref:hypothetical protein n=1 Tax=Sphingobium sp. AP50 TaxID=1884369 RepID=UPI0008CE204B|nr:hypothetical protein [Sphingobium sp. AP50]SEJ45865.1 hypothetical protein SAMN05518849_10713 [Sphingobium sp. AP50]